MRLFKNTSTEHRVWPSLKDHDTGTTLELAPGESARVDLPVDFEDPHLTLVPVRVTKLKETAPSDDDKEN